jgi:hypothetical protein
MNIIQALNDPNLLGGFLRDPGTWAAWLTFLKALSGLPLDDAELSQYRAYTGRETAPGGAFGEAWVVAGRRSGKSFISALIAVFLACFRDYRPHLAAGERAMILLIAADRNQAQVIFKYIQGFLTSNPLLTSMVESDRAESIDLSNRVTIQVATCSYRSIRGFTAAAVLADEVAFWARDDGSNPASEVFRAVRPALTTIPGSLLLCISSPYARSGPLYEAHKAHYGQDGADVLIWQASTTAMNPTIDRELINRDLAKDPEAARSEWLAEFRSDLESYLTQEAIEAAAVQGRRELPPAPGVYYRAFVDPSGGRGDAAALAIAHVEGGKAVLDVVRRYPAPHDPAVVVGEMARTLWAYRVYAVMGDRYAGAWPEQEFRKHGIRYEAAVQDKSGLYLEFLPRVLSGGVELLDDQVLIRELAALERRTRSSGRDMVDHPPRGHDDLANAVAGVCVLAAGVVSGPIEYRTVERRLFEGRGNAYQSGEHGRGGDPIPSYYRKWKGF